MIKRLRGYAAGKDRKTNSTRNFFVGNLKLHNSTMNGTEKQLDRATRFYRNLIKINVHTLSLKRDKSEIMDNILKWTVLKYNKWTRENVISI